MKSMNSFYDFDNFHKIASESFFEGWNEKSS